jgi:hypothetical protein
MKSIEVSGHAMELAERENQNLRSVACLDSAFFADYGNSLLFL